MTDPLVQGLADCTGEIEAWFCNPEIKAEFERWLSDDKSRTAQLAREVSERKGRRSQGK